VDGDGHPVAALLEGRLERANDLEIGLEIREAPLPLERHEEPAEVAGRRGEARSLDLDLVETDDGIDDELANRNALPDDLAVDLTLGRHVDEEIPVDLGSTAQPAIRSEAPEAVVLGLVGTPWREVAAARFDPVLREAALSREDLATTAEPAPAADGIEIDPERSGCIEHRGTDREPTAPA